MKRVLACVLMVALVALAGCDSGDGSSDGNGGGGDTAVLNLTGTWKGTWKDNGGNDSGALTIVATQTGTKVSGTLTLKNSQGTVYTAKAGGTATAQAPGTFSVTWSVPNVGTAVFTGSYDATKASGTWDDGQGGSGTFKLARQ